MMDYYAFFARGVGLVAGHRRMLCWLRPQRLLALQFCGVSSLYLVDMSLMELISLVARLLDFRNYLEADLPYMFKQRFTCECSRVVFRIV